MSGSGDMAISAPVHSGKFLKKIFIAHLAKGHPYRVSGSYLKNYGFITQITVHGKVAPSPFGHKGLLKYISGKQTWVNYIENVINYKYKLLAQKCN